MFVCLCFFRLFLTKTEKEAHMNTVYLIFDLKHTSLVFVRTNSVRYIYTPRQKFSIIAFQTGSRNHW